MVVEAFNPEDRNCNEFIENLKPFFKLITPEGLTDAQKKEFIDMREAVLGCHFLVETQFNIILANRLLRDSKITLDKEKELEKLLDKYVKMYFKPKIKLMKALFNGTQIDFSVISQLDDLRDVFAHNLPLKDKRYKNVKSKKNRLDLFGKISTVISNLILLRIAQA